VAWAAVRPPRNASLTQMSPSFANSATKAGSFFSFLFMETGVFQAQDVAILHRGHGPLAAGLADAVVGEWRPAFLITRESASATGLSESLASASLRPARNRRSRMEPCPPLPEISVMVGRDAFRAGSHR